MSRRAEYHIEARFLVTPTDIEAVRSMSSPSSRFCWITGQYRATVYTLRGVPGAKIDVLLPQSDSPLLGWEFACEIGLKKGCYDGSQRWRICFRPWSSECQEGLEPNLQWCARGTIKAEESHSPDGECMDVLARWQGGGLWMQSFPQLRFECRDGDRRGILMHHYHKYFSFLPVDDAQQLAEMWSLLPHTMVQTDIVVLNRTASAALYDLAVSSGWRKLTLKDKRRYSLSPDAASWQRADSLVIRMAVRDGVGDKAGVGQYTRAASQGKPAHVLGVCIQCGGLTAECPCRN